jgi:2-C-methyl-D-erythritol 4-phosphate cytidylyltransferase
MDVATLLTQIKRQFGDEYDVIITDDDIYGWIHDAQLDIIRRTGINEQSVTTSVSAFPVSVPEQITIKRVNIDGKALTYVSREELDMLSLSTVQGPSTPKYWYRSERHVRLWPQDATDTTTQVQIQYAKVPVLLDGSGGEVLTVPESYHTDVLHYCLARAHNKNENWTGERQEMDYYERNVGNRMAEATSPDTALYKLPDPMDFDLYYG